jgi:hypothetical protein
MRLRTFGVSSDNYADRVTTLDAPVPLAGALGG